MDRRGVLSGEQGTVLKKWTNRVPVCVAFPSSYYIGMSNLSLHLLYRVLNERPEVVCERLFFDEEGGMRSVESGRPLDAFELVFLTLSFEMDYPNIPRMLRAGSTAVFARERGGSAPIVVAGGMCAMANPEPLSSFFDLFLMGDVEACIPPFVDRYLQVRGKKRPEIVDDLSSWKWAYNPARLDVSYKDDGTIEAFTPASFGVEIERYKGKNLAQSAIITGETEFANMLLAEGSRGCPSRCAFCLTGNASPFILDDLEQIEGETRDVGIIGGGVSFHPRLGEIIRRLKESGIRVHLPSLRLDEVPLDVIDLLKDSIKTLTFGIEAGSESLRRLIGKPLSDEDLFDRIEAIAGIESFNFKFYFMVGLPREQRADMGAIVDLVKHILHLLVRKGRKKGRIGGITVHASPFVPKASTPFQWLAMDDPKELKEKISILKRGLGKVANTHFTHESIKYSFLQAVFARGDRRLKDMIVRVSQGENLTTIMRDSPINPSFYATRERGRDELFPWDFIGNEGEKDLLFRRLSACLGATPFH